MTFFRRLQHPADEALSAYLDQQLPEESRQRLEAHVAACVSCAEALEGLRAVRSGLADLPRVAAPRSFALREADVRPQPAASPLRGLNWASPALTGVASLALVAFLALVSIDAFGGNSMGNGAGSSADTSSGAQSLSAGERGAEGATSAAREVAPGKSVANDSDESANPQGGPADVGATPGSARNEAPSAGKLQDTPCPTCSYFERQPPAPTAIPPEEPATDASDDDGNTSLRLAEGAAAAVALTSSGGLAFLWWRRRA